MATDDRAMPLEAKRHETGECPVDEPQADPFPALTC